MKLTKMTQPIHSVSMGFFLMLSAPVFSQSNDWMPVTGADNLHDFMSSLTVERKLPSGEMSIQYFNFVERADAFAPEHQTRFTVGPVVKLPWKGRG